MATARIAQLPGRLRPETGYLMTRLGGNGDGGYIVPVHALLRCDFLLGLGLFYDWEFEREFHALVRPKAVHCYDHSVTKGKFFRLGAVAALKAAIGSVPRKRWPKIKLALSYFGFFGKPNVRHFVLAISDKDSDGSRSLTSALESLGDAKGSVFLKADIEGSEYLIVDQIILARDRFTGLAIEFHDLTTRPDVFFSAIDLLLKDFCIVHIHANTVAPFDAGGLPDVLEISFVSRRLADELKSAEMPARVLDGQRFAMDTGELDAPNSTNTSEIELRYA